MPRLSLRLLEIPPLIGTAQTSTIELPLHGMKLNILDLPECMRGAIFEKAIRRMGRTGVSCRVVVVELVACTEGETVLRVEDVLRLPLDLAAGAKNVEVRPRVVRVSEFCWHRCRHTVHNIFGPVVVATTGAEVCAHVCLFAFVIITQDTVVLDMLFIELVNSSCRPLLSLGPALGYQEPTVCEGDVDFCCD